MLAAVGLLILLLVLSLTDAGPVMAQAIKHVVVVNTPQSPVPTTVTGIVFDVRDVDNPARHSFLGGCTINTLGNPNGRHDCVVGTVPAGSVLAVETVTAKMEINSAVILRGIVMNGLVLTATPLPLSTQGNFQGLTVSQPLRTYLPAGADIRGLTYKVQTLSRFWQSSSSPVTS